MSQNRKTHSKQDGGNRHQSGSISHINPKFGEVRLQPIKTSDKRGKDPTGLINTEKQVKSDSKLEQGQKDAKIKISFEKRNN